MYIESIRLKNFKSFRNVQISDIPRLCVVVGANGVGKTTLFEVFAFLKDSLVFTVRHALQRRGGFREVLSRGGSVEEGIEIELGLRHRMNGADRRLSYLLHIGEQQERAVVLRELLRYVPDPQRADGHEAEALLDFTKGDGYIRDGAEEGDGHSHPGSRLRLGSREQDQVVPDVLAIGSLGHFQELHVAPLVRQLIENIYISDVRVGDVRGSKEASGADEYLSVTGDNLQRVAYNLYRNHPDIFERILKRLRRSVPGVETVTPKRTEDGRLLLQFGDAAFRDPFSDRYVSDGTLKMFAYLVLLYEPRHHALLCIEEPENQLYRSLLWELGEDFRAYAERGGQVLITTHSPDLLNAMALDEVFWLTRRNGYTEVHRARDDQQLRAYMAEGDQLGYLWREGLFAGADPK